MIEELAKAELHVHLEGTVPPALIQTLADRNGLTVPDGVFKTPEQFRWVDFLDFLRTYDLAASVIRTEQDYRDITYEYLMGCAREGAIYVELIVSPDHAALVGLPAAALAMIKATVDGMWHGPLHGGLRSELLAQVALFGSEDYQAAKRARAGQA